MPQQPHVSVVIPTCQRPELASRAVRSALAQTYADIEVIVVIDGPDPATTTALAGIGDDRIRVIALPERRKAPNARNVGARAARGRWTALLDDDDEWRPQKLAVQLRLAETMTARSPVVA